MVVQVCVLGATGGEGMGGRVGEREEVVDWEG
jgi:hypothetical protein